MAHRRTTSRPSESRAARRRKLLGGLVVAICAVAGTIGVVFVFNALAIEDGIKPSERPARSGPVQPAPRPTQVVSFEQGCTTAECHAGFLGVGVHEPVQQAACEACHLPDSGGHTYPLVAEGDGLCRKCHEELGQGSIQHAAMTKEGCLACHEPHRSDAPALLVGEDVETTCRRCHARATGLVRHEPYEQGRCAACHEPHESEYAGLLRGGAGRDHCRQCHADLVERVESLRHTHAGIERDCQSCHSAHATTRESLLTRDAGVGCLECHEQIRATVEEAAVAHGAVMDGKRCVSCHNPHASDVPNMLRDQQALVCMACHDKEQQARDGTLIRSMKGMGAAEVVHGPVEQSQCSACHSVHGGTRDRLLKQLAPRVVYGPFDIRNYALCFQCHDQALALEPTTTTATQFRHGERNLHWVHLAGRGQGRSCGQCHAVHASASPRLIAEQVAYQESQWMMEMNFKLQDDGGSCAPGCHEPLTYVRGQGRPAESPGGGP